MAADRRGHELKRRTLHLAVAVLLASAAPAFASDHTPPPAGVATSYPAVDVHAADKIAIAADPYNTKEKESLFRVDYLAAGFMPIRIIVTNNSDRSISLSDARINFITADGDRIPAAEPEDVERRLTRSGNPNGGVRLPAPLPRLGGKPSGKNKQVEEDFNSLEYSAITVAPHTTQSGFLFYDVSGVHNPLAGGKLNLRTLRDADGKELFYFEIPLEKYLAAQSHAPHTP